MVDILNTAVSGLMAARTAISNTGHNIANVNTPYYSRQRVELGASTPEPYSFGSLGRGVDVVKITRAYDDFILQQLRDHNSSVAHYETLSSLTTEVSTALGDADVGLTPDLESFFGALHDVADSPALLTSRQVFIDTSRNLTTRMKDIGLALNTLRDSANTGIQNVVNEINNVAESIASVSRDIAAGDISVTNQPNDLMDQRDKLLGDLSELVGIHVVVENSGALSVFLADGKALVVGSTVNKLVASQSGYDPQDITVRFESDKQGTDIEDFITEGQLGGYFDFRRNVLHPAQDGLGLLAMGLSETLNEQHQQGMDLDGELGGQLFQYGEPKVWANTLNESEAVFSAELNHYTTPYQLECIDDGSTNGLGRPSYNLKRLSDGNIVAAGFTLTNANGTAVPFTADGVTITMTAGVTVAVGDRFLLEPNAKGDYSSTYVGNDGTTDVVFKSVALPVSDSSKLLRSDYKITVTGAGSNARLTNSGDATIEMPSVFNALNMNLTNKVEIRFTDSTTYDVFDVTANEYLAQNQSYTSGDPIPPTGDYNGWSVKITDGTRAIAGGDIFDISAGYTVTRLSDRTEILSNGDISALNTALRKEGISVSMSGEEPKYGDSFLLQPTRRSAAGFDLVLADPRKLAVAAPIVTVAESTNLGTGTISAGRVVDSSREALSDKVEIRFTSENTFDVYDLATETLLDRGATYPPMVSMAGPDNFGTATITKPTIVDYNNVRLHNTLEVQFISSTRYNVVDVTTGETLDAAVTYTSPGGTVIPASGTGYNGIQFVISGEPKAGDIFQVKSASENEISYNGWAVNITGAPKGGMVVSANHNNTGTATVTQPTMGAQGYAAEKLDHRLELTFDTALGTYTITDLDDATATPISDTYTAPGPLTITVPDEYGGWSFTVNGDPATSDKFNFRNTGDVFQVVSNKGGIGDSRNGQELVALQTKNQLLNGNDYRGVYTTLIAEVGAAGSHTDSILKSREALRAQSASSRESRSGVNLDEEAADLMRFQMAYQASAQMIQSANTLFSTLISAVRG